MGKKLADLSNSMRMNHSRPRDLWRKWLRGGQLCHCCSDEREAAC